MSGRSCQYCDSDRLVPVLDKNIEERDKPGNKYRRLCLACDRFGRMAGGDEWRNHPDARILPAGEPRKASAVVEASLFETADDDDEPENEFDCPVCGRHLTGYPEQCPECSAAFEWPEKPEKPA